MTHEERFERIEAKLEEITASLAETNKIVNRIGKYAMILARDFDTRIAVPHHGGFVILLRLLLFLCGRR